MIKPRFRFEYEVDARPIGGWQSRKGDYPRRWFIYHELLPIRVEVSTLQQAADFLEPHDPAWAGVALLFLTSADRVVLCPWAPISSAKEKDQGHVKAIEQRAETSYLQFASGRVWMHVPGDSAT